MSSIKALVSTWAQIIDEAEFPASYEGTAIPKAHSAREVVEVMQAMQECIDQA